MEYYASIKSGIREEYLMNFKDISNIIIVKNRLKKRKVLCDPILAIY